MSSPKKSRLFAFVVFPVALVIVAAFAISAASVYENMRFVRATSQILSFIRNVRTYVGAQGSPALVQGEDIWASMVQAGQISKATPEINPWGGPLTAVAVANSSLRIENELPTRDCRRIALYFLGLQPAELGILSIEAQPGQNRQWYSLYPNQLKAPIAMVGASCGTMPLARLAIVFKVR